jgi:hypothetical protein
VRYFGREVFSTSVLILRTRLLSFRFSIFTPSFSFRITMLHIEGLFFFIIFVLLVRSVMRCCSLVRATRDRNSHFFTAAARVTTASSRPPASA